VDKIRKINESARVEETYPLDMNEGKIRNLVEFLFLSQPT